MGMAGLSGFIIEFLWSYLALHIVVILVVTCIICVDNDLSRVMKLEMFQ